MTLWVLRKTWISSLLTTLLMPNVSVSPTNSPDTNWMSYNSVTTLTWSSHRYYRLRAHPQDCPQTSDFNHSRVSPVLLTDRDTTGAHYTLLRFDNLLEQLIELGKTVYLLDYRFIIRGYSSETARKEAIHRTSYVKGEHHPPSTSLCITK